jgi:uncharacterized membrane protein
MRTLLAILLAVLPASSLAQTSACTADHYKIVAIPLVPAAINDSGEIAGTTPAQKAALWTEKNGVAALPVLPGFRMAEAIGINARGDVIGVARNDAAGKRQGFFYHQGRMLRLSGAQSKPSAINNAGDIAGEARLAHKEVSAAVLWKDQVPIDFGGCCGGTATSLNNHGQVAGQIYDEQGRYDAFLWDSTHGVQHIGPVNAYSAAVTMNDQGHVIVQEFTRHGVSLYADGKLTPLDLSPKFPSRPRAMNNCDALVGSFGPFADAERAFLWDRSRGFHDLNDLIPAGSGWKLEAATGVNNRGEIVGWGDYKHQEDKGFLLIPEP